MNKKGGLEYLFVSQKEIKFIGPNRYIGSFGAKPCTIFCAFHKELGTLCGHIDAETKSYFVNRYLNIFNYFFIKIYFFVLIIFIILSLVSSLINIIDKNKKTLV